MIDTLRHTQAMDKIADLVNVRERTCREVTERLLECGFSHEEAEEAVASAVRCGMVDEERFVRSFVRGKVSLGWGERKIADRLARAGIDASVIERCADEFPGPDEQYDMALRELSRKPFPSSRDPRSSLARRLVNKGYAPELALRATDEFLSSRSAAQ